ncbi:uncharacterized protein LOC124543425 [Vanessa cardui]|uniref:uncharacterized protein LOC124543425 n=1 Tax=Vanessa cardui TaxID=171605 RepID=UPI001F134AE4|nr:uncharacterized protein LOC124543425 [Vanessa cardui]
MTRSLLFILGLAGVMSIPVDEPIRIDLPVYDQPQSASNIPLAEPLEPENHPLLSSNNDKSSAGNAKGPVFNILGNKISPEYPASGAVNDGGFFSPPYTKLEGALLETEGYGSKTLSIKENAQNIVAGILQPKPIVDTIREEDKYGNDGDKFRNAGRAIVGGAEGISNFLNSILEVPSKIIKSITRAASEKLNNIGGKLIGL